MYIDFTFNSSIKPSSQLGNDANVVSVSVSDPRSQLQFKQVSFIYFFLIFDAAKS